jgi:hypothetical protein
MTTDRQKQALEAIKIHGSHKAAARVLGISKSSLANLIKRSTRGPRDTSHETVDTVETQDGFLLTVRSLDRIQTAAQAMQKAGIDDAIWMPVKVTANSWEVAARQADKSIVTLPLWQVRVECKRRVSHEVEVAAEALARRIAEGKFKWTAPKYVSRSDPHQLFLGLVDHHFGKLAWGPEVGGHNGDLELSRVVYERAIAETVDMCRGHHIDKIVMPIGNDFAHIDNNQGTTAAGTPLDHDGRYSKIAGVMEEAVIRGVRQAREIAPVEVVWIPGNHDPVTSLWICRVVRWAFDGDKHVSVDTSPSPVKYRHFGKCLIGMAHGDGPRDKALKDMMPIERADEWAASKACREWLTGHLHQQRKTERLGTFEEAGQVFRILASLAPTDNWHYRNGFSMTRKATESYLYSYEWGKTGSWEIPLAKLLTE